LRQELHPGRLGSLAHAATEVVLNDAIASMKTVAYVVDQQRVLQCKIEWMWTDDGMEK
jgi:hypothetical protein